MTDPELIRAAIEASGLSARRFATHVISRDERTVRNWLAGTNPIPPVARDWLEHWLSLTDAQRSRVIRALDAA